jgi:filamentous hemagglutinin family protein
VSFHGFKKGNVLKSLIRLSSLGLIWIWNSDGSRSLVLAQIIPDETLGQENSEVVPNQTINGVEADLIQGGARRGGNLFHSFQDFSIEAGRGAYFDNPNGVQNIFGRVTGGNISQILGTLGVRDGNANLFLLNPNGIIFGKDSSLDLKGSFLATTADSLVFDNGFKFGATNPEAPTLLTINTPLGLQFGSTPGNIVNRSQGGEVERVFNRDRALGLEVLPNQTIGLIGGRLSLENGNITAKGRIELGAVASNSFVTIQTQDGSWRLNYDGVENFEDISLKNSWILLNEVEKMGSIAFQGKRIDINGSFINLINLGSVGSGKLTLSASESVMLDNGSQILSLTRSQASAGDIKVEALQSVQLTGANTLIVSQGEIGNSGNVDISTKKLILQDGGRIGASTIGSGQAGTIKIGAQESLEVIGFGISTNGRRSISGLIARSETSATGDAGTIIINTPNLLVQDGAEISTATLSNSGRGGNIIIDNAELVRITGTSTDKTINSRLTATTERAPTGGSVKINTNRLLVEDGGQILTSTFGEGEGGSINIISSELLEVVGSSGNFFSIINSGGLTRTSTGNAGEVIIITNQLNLREGGKIAVSTFGGGKGGELNISASNIELTGRSVLDDGTNEVSFIRSRTLGSGQAGGINITTETLTLKDGADIAVSSTESGDSGNLNISASQISIAENGTINLSATGTGKGGNLEINTDTLELNNGSITATTASNEGGNITLNIDDNLLFRNQGEISATAGIAQAEGNGGNIRINSDFIFAFPPQKKYEITAEAFGGNGGNIAIETNYIFGENNINISASSNFGLDGTVTIVTPEVDPTTGVLELPATPIDAESLIAKDVCRIEDGKIARGSSFIITGKGGLPPSAEDPPINSYRIVGWETLSEEQDNSTVGMRSRPQTDERGEETYPVIQEAQGWKRLSDGTLLLVAQATTVTPQSPEGTSPHCQSR